MNIRTYADFETALLLATFCIAERAQNDFVPMKVILETYKLDGQPHWLDRAYAGNIQTGAFNNTRTAGSAVDQDAWLTPAGARRAEDLMRSLGEPPRGRSKFLHSVEESPTASKFEPFEVRAPVIPASDRLVRLDHNSAEIVSIKAKSSELIKQLRQANDLGGMTPEEASVAAHEVEQLRIALDVHEVRQNTILQLASRSLSWIVSKAGEALVGALAVGLMALVFSFFGIVIPV